MTRKGGFWLGRIDYKQCCDEHLRSLKEFYIKNYRSDHPLVGDKFFQWQYKENPYFNGGGYSCMLALDGDQVVGHLGWVPIPMSIRGRQAIAVWEINGLVDPSYRRRGIFSTLTEIVSETYDYAMTISPSGIGRKIWQRLGFTDYGDLTRYILLDYDSPRSGGYAEYTPAQYYATRSQEYIQWRYLSHPNLEYEILHGPDSGFAVVRLEWAEQLDALIARMVDLVSDSVVEQKALLDTVIDWCVAHNAQLLDFFCAGGRFDGLFSAYGFIRGDSFHGKLIPRLFQPIEYRAGGIGFMAKGVDTDLDLWYVTSGDGDVDRPNIIS